MWGEDWRAEDEVTGMALVGRRDGRNFGYGRQSSNRPSVSAPVINACRDASLFCFSVDATFGAASEPSCPKQVV
jgi:hypothetical protein